MTREEAAPYLLRLFAAGDRGILPADFALACGLTLPRAMLVLEDLYRQRLLARVPNPRGKGYVCRTPKRGDEQAGFLFDPTGEPVREGHERLAEPPPPPPLPLPLPPPPPAVRSRRTVTDDQLQLF